MHPLHRILTALLLAAAAGLPAPLPAQERESRAVQVVALEPLADAAPAGNGGLFVGVNQFRSDTGLSDLDYAVHDAIELAHLFVLELKLIPPKNTVLLLSGTPNPAATTVQAHLQALKAAGVRLDTADRLNVLTAAVTMQKFGRGESDLIVCSFSSHGFEDNRQAYFMPADGTRVLLRETAIPVATLETLFEPQGQNKGGTRLLLVDACQERMPARSIGGVAAPTARMDAAFKTALAESSGQATFVSCQPGQYSWEDKTLGGVGHGVFSYAILEALRGGAKLDEGNLVRLGAVAEYTQTSVEAWCLRNEKLRQSPGLLGPESARRFPLAARGTDLATLLAALKRQPATPQFPQQLRDDLAALLPQLDPQDPAARQVLAETKDYLHGKIPDRFFGPYLERVLPTLRVTKPAQPTVKVDNWTDYQWLKEQLDREGIDKLIERFDAATQTDDVAAVWAALRLSRNILKEDKQQLWFQVQARTLEKPTLQRQWLAARPPGEHLTLRSITFNQAGGQTDRTLEDDQKSVRCVAVSSDGESAISGSKGSNTLKVWDTATGRVLRTLEGHTGGVKCVAVSSNGKTAISGSDDETLKVWNIATGQMIHSLSDLTEIVTPYRIVFNGKVYAPQLEIQQHAATTCLALRYDAQLAVFGGKDETLKIWEVPEGRMLRAFAGDEGQTEEKHTEIISCVALSPDGLRAVSGSGDKTLKIWDITKSQILRTLVGHTGKVWCVALSPDGKTAVSGSADETLKVWDIASGHLLRTIKGHTGDVWRVALSADGKRVASGGWSDNTLKVWNLATGDLLATYDFDGHVRALALEGHTLVVGDSLGRVHFLDFLEK